MPERNLVELQTLGFQIAGKFILEDKKLLFRLNKNGNDRGSYVFVVNEKVKYVGVTKNSLYARMNGYKNPGSTQETNKRIKPELVKAGVVLIYFLPESDITKFATTIRGKGFEKQIPTDMSTFERFLISIFQPEWNRY